MCSSDLLVSLISCFEARPLGFPYHSYSGTLEHPHSICLAPKILSYPTNGGHIGVHTPTTITHSSSAWISASPFTQFSPASLRSDASYSCLVLRTNLELLTRRISEMPALHTLNLHLCRIPRMVRRRLVLNSLPLSWQITNLIYIDSAFQETHSH